MGYIKTIREDGKIDVTLQKQGFVQNIDEFKQKILDKLEENYGLLYLTDNSSRRNKRRIADE
jgi:predicted RNA-binding protein (virulence factor B family)